MTNNHEIHQPIIQTLTGLAVAGSAGGGVMSGIQIFLNNNSGALGVIVAFLSLIAAIIFGLWNIYINKKAKRFDREKFKNDLLDELRSEITDQKACEVIDKKKNKK